jgi:hypothetical protein
VRAGPGEDAAGEEHAMIARRGLLVALAVALALGGCSYADPVDRSGIESAAVLPERNVAVVFRQLRYAPATGLAAFPDGGIPRYLRDSEIIGVLSPDGRAHVLQRIANPGEPGTLAASLRVAAVDPDHLIVIRSWQPRGGVSVASWARMAWRDGNTEPYPDFAAVLKRQGREFGSPAFGDIRALDAAGALLIGARDKDQDELWLYEPGRELRRIDGFRHFYGVAGDELYYWSGDEAVVRNWRTGAARQVARYDPTTRMTTRLLMDDPTVRTIERPQAGAAQPEISSDRRSVRLPGDGGAGLSLSAPSDWWPR